MKSKMHKTTASLQAVAFELPDLIAAAQVDIDSIAHRMEVLKRAGLVYASPFWRKDAAGVERYLYLLHPQIPGVKRRRDYVGCDPERIQEANAGIERAKEYEELKKQLQVHTTCIAHAHDGLANAVRYLKRPIPREVSHGRSRVF